MTALAIHIDIDRSGYEQQVRDYMAFVKYDVVSHPSKDDVYLIADGRGRFLDPFSLLVINVTGALTLIGRAHFTPTGLTIKRLKPMVQISECKPHDVVEGYGGSEFVVLEDLCTLTRDSLPTRGVVLLSLDRRRNRICMMDPTTRVRVVGQATITVEYDDEKQHTDRQDS